MEKTVVPTSGPAVAVTPTPTAPRRKRSALENLLVPLASLRLTVWLFVLSFFLVFAGTLAQTEFSIQQAVDQYFRSFFVWIPWQLFVRFGQIFFGFPTSWSVSGSFPFFGGWLLGSALLVNLLAAHLTRFKLSWQRSGILLIHSGLVVMMLGELVTGLYAIEGRMAIREGESINYVEQFDKLEIAVVDPSGKTEEDVTVVPVKLLQRRGTVTHPDLPFDLELVQFMPNSNEPRKATAEDKNPATAGLGKEEIAVEVPSRSGADPNQRMDIASAYVTIKEKGNGNVLGTWLLSQWYSRPQPIAVGGKTYDVALRSKRTYKPYTIGLIDFKHEVYPGTNKPKNFSSEIRLVDPSRERDRTVKISMNDPLRYRGETFYQASFLEGDIGTVLQVVRNPGWLMPYISCAVVTFGMILHFGLHLLRFLNQRATTAA